MGSILEQRCKREPWQVLEQGCRPKESVYSRPRPTDCGCCQRSGPGLGSVSGSCGPPGASGNPAHARQDPSRVPPHEPRAPHGAGAQTRPAAREAFQSRPRRACMGGAMRGGVCVIPTPVPTQVGFSGSFQWPLPLWVAPKSLSWMSPQLVWTLLPVEAFGSCCSNTRMVRIEGGLRFPWILLERPEDVSDKEVLGDGVLRDE